MFTKKYLCLTFFKLHGYCNVIFFGVISGKLRNNKVSYQKNQQQMRDLRESYCVKEKFRYIILGEVTQRA